MKTILAKTICVSALGLMLSACGESKNPLSEKPVTETVELLTSASEKVSPSVGLPKARAGDNFRQCMKKNIDAAVCSKLVSAIKVELAKKGIKVSETHITDPALYKEISPQLDHVSWLME